MLNCDLHTRFLYWQREREAIRIKKERGDPRPWTANKILDTYRFCNVKREDDKVTRWINEHIRVPYRLYPTLPVMLAIGRWVNEPGTLHYMIHSQGWPLDAHWSRAQLYGTLKVYKDFGKRVYNPAYVISPCGNKDKDKFVVDTIAHVFDNLNEMPHETLEDTFRWINQFNGWGQFMSYQWLIDLRHTEFLKHAPDVKTFAAFGPGTTRGLNRLFGRSLEAKPKANELTNEIKWLQAQNELDLEASDICNCLCEFDKYERTFNGEGKPKQLYR